MDKKVIRIISKVALFLVLFGFFQPVACDMKGFQLANHLMEYHESTFTIASIGVYVVFFAAVLSIFFSIILLITKQNLCSTKATGIDFTLLLLSIAGGVIAVLVLIDQIGKDIFNNGSYIILAGWVVSLIFLLASIERKKE